MVNIKKQVIEAIVAHAKKEAPVEACGYLAGKSGVITRHYELTNVDHSPEHFSFDPAEQFNVVKQARNENLEIMANYHSHPASPARPSQEDIRLAYDPGISYFIVSLAGDPEIKSFKIKNGVVTQQKIEIIE
ncbi:Mov34/MPN/PAD-1 [hydrothermal vent metagenome]|uniref:Mov34/MPN/PAD-1 n=1 Tax=hydrothermal vent metagenome TaxID=652676 RepID=A0A3B0UFX3_9ZZZZ